jgi:hypothetical protein
MLKCILSIEIDGVNILLFWHKAGPRPLHSGEQSMVAFQRLHIYRMNFPRKDKAETSACMLSQYESKPHTPCTGKELDYV